MTHSHLEQNRVRAGVGSMPALDRGRVVAAGGLVRIALVGQRSLCTSGIVATLAISRFALVFHWESFEEFQAIEPHVHPALCLYVTRIDDLPEAVEHIAGLKRSTPELRIVACSESAEDAGILTAAGADAHILTGTRPEALLTALDALVKKPSNVGEGRKPDAPPTGTRSSQSNRYEGLSAREVEVAAAIARGQSNKTVARQLAIAEPTVKAHMRAILRKTGVANRTQLALWLSRRSPAAALQPRHPRSSRGLDPNLRPGDRSTMPLSDLEANGAADVGRPQARA